MHVKCQPVTTREDLETCLAVRQKVFVEEQDVPLDREMDEYDQTARHFAVQVDEQIVATCRVRFMGSAAKIERMAVLKDFRSKGIGMVLMKYILQELSRAGDIQLFKLSSQAHAVPFYEKLGFKTRGSEYMDAGIPHYDMIREIG